MKFTTKPAHKLNQRTHYAVLGVPPASEQAAVREAYLALAIAHHPDKGGDAEVFKAITGAYAVLKDAERRRAYDVALRLLGGQCETCMGRGLRGVALGLTKSKEIICADCGGTGCA